MSRFVKIPTKSGAIKLLNADYIRQVVYLPGDTKNEIVEIIVERGMEYAVFDAQEKALEFIEQNFILLNK